MLKLKKCSTFAHFLLAFYYEQNMRRIYAEYLQKRHLLVWYIMKRLKIIGNICNATNKCSVGILLMLCMLPQVTSAQQRTGLSGVVVDAQTGETLPFVQIYFIKSSSNGSIATTIGTTSDMDGNFSIYNSEGYTTVNFQMMGYKTEMHNLRVGQTKKNIKIKMEPDVYGLQDIVVKPKNQKQKYKRKGNPAVDLIREVIAHKDSFTVKATDHYIGDTYSRMSFALDNFHPNFQKGFWKTFAFAEKYIDTTGVYPSLTISIREHISNEYYQRKPHREKRILQKKRIFGIEDIIDSQSFQENINSIFKDIDINNDNMNLLFNRFVSPLSSSLAVTYYQYYIMDTIMVDGYPCIDLAFVPVNSESYSFTGHLYIVNDSTFKLKKYAINIPPHINLNFVSDYSIEHSYRQLENGLWAPDRTTTYAKFYILNNKRGMLARQTKIYTGWDFDSEIDKQIFSSMTAEEAQQDSTAQRLGMAEWNVLRPEPLTTYETSVYDLVGEFTSNPTFASLAMFVNAVTTEFIPTKPARDMDDSKFDIGPIYQFVSWNTLEGVRLRVGGASTAKLHDQLFFRGYVAFGTQDLRPKYNATLMYSFNKKKHQGYEPLRHYIQASVQYDVEEPGRADDIIRRDHILNSIPTSKPTLKNNQYVFHAKLDYMKDWRNGLTVKSGFDFSNNEAAGAMTYDRIMSYTPSGNIGISKHIRDYQTYSVYAELKYSPGAKVFIDRMGVTSPFAMDKDAPVISLKHTFGYLDDRKTGGQGFFINKTELTADKRFWLSSFGHLDMRVQTGMVWNKIPFTELYSPNTSTSIFLAQRSFNLMQPMEFLMDEYVALYLTYYFKGWILNRIPGINRLKLRGVVSFSGIYGGLTNKNNPYLTGNEGLYMFPESATFDNVTHEYLSGYTSSPIGKLPYMEITAGFENILKFIRIDYVRRLTYNDYELPNGNRRKLGGWGRNGVKITFRIAL